MKKFLIWAKTSACISIFKQNQAGDAYVDQGIWNCLNDLRNVDYQLFYTVPFFNNSISKNIFLKNSVEECQNYTFKVNFWCQKLIKLKKKSLVNINLENIFWLKHFLRCQFLNHFITKIMPSFWRTDIHRPILLSFFLQGCWFLAKNHVL